ncbi:hypothetical protein [Chroococcidiopsis sp.]|uniref:hypothetical protein n=1 Tax=Chroococcidiopsis sp. TaxID=3088168 RepID=UPI003F2DAF51
MNQQMLEWFESRKDAIAASESWDDFCESQGELGTRLKNKQSWYGDYYTTWKAYPHTFLLFPVVFPEVKSITELFKELTWVANPEGTSKSVPYGWHYIATPRLTSDRPTLDRHYVSLYGKYSEILKGYVDQVNIRLDYATELIGRDDGVLVTLGSNWLTLLDTDLLLSELPAHDKLIVLAK